MDLRLRRQFFAEEVAAVANLKTLLVTNRRKEPVGRPLSRTRAAASAGEAQGDSLRVLAPSTLGSTMDEPTFGARFLREFRFLGGSTKEWPSKAVDSLADADRCAFCELVATGRTPIPAELSATANVWEPEAVARRLFDRVKRERDRERALHSGLPFAPCG